MPLGRLPRAALMLAGIAATTCLGAGERLDHHYLDTAVSPCHDFFQYANGGWLRANPIPADYSVWGVDEEIEQRNLNILRRILESAAAHPGAHATVSQQIGDFYAAAMDEAAIERAGAAPLQPELADVAALKTPADVAALIRTWQARGIDAVFELQAQEDLKDSGTDIAYAGQGGLGLPDRDYYTRQDSKSVLLRTRYRAHVARMLALVGDADAAEEAGWVLQLETTLAEASLDPIALREPTNSYHMFTTQQADAATPNFAWSMLFAAADRSDVQQFSLAQPEFFAAVDKALAGLPVAHWQAYLRWHLIDDAGPYLGRRFVDADFDFRGRSAARHQGRQAALETRDRQHRRRARRSARPGLRRRSHAARCASARARSRRAAQDRNARAHRQS